MRPEPVEGPHAAAWNGGTLLQVLVVTRSIAIDAIINAGEDWFIPSGEEDVDQSKLYEVLAP
jgi:hypothetical protein